MFCLIVRMPCSRRVERLSPVARIDWTAAHARVPRAAERAGFVVDGPVPREARVAEAVLAPACEKVLIVNQCLTRQSHNVMPGVHLTMS